MKYEDEDLYKKARKKVKAKKGFFYHLAAYAAVIGMLYAIMHFENNGEILPVIIVGLSWGIGLAAHYLSVFGLENLEILGVKSNWEEEELEKELDRLKRKRKLQDEIKNEKDLLEESDRLDLKELERRPLDKDDLV